MVIWREKTEMRNHNVSPKQLEVRRCLVCDYQLKYYKRTSSWIMFDGIRMFPFPRIRENPVRVNWKEFDRSQQSDIDNTSLTNIVGFKYITLFKIGSYTTIILYLGNPLLIQYSHLECTDTNRGNILHCPFVGEKNERLFTLIQSLRRRVVLRLRMVCN